MARSVWVDAVLVVVTLGLYMPYWLYERNKRLRETRPGLELPDNLWWLVGGLVLTFLGAWLAFGDAFWSSALHLAAVAVFTVGVYILARNGEVAAEAAGFEWRMRPPLVAGLFGGAFALVQLGNVFPGFLPRALALTLLLSLPIVFYFVWHDLDRLIPDAPTAPAPAATS